ncbi:hypothetical protein JNUCC64_26755 [Streptomyces sp. JNUCC 64]
MASHRKQTALPRVLGAVAGVLLTVQVVPGVSLLPFSPWPGALVTACSLFVIVNQLIYAYPQRIRTAPPPVTLVLAAFGVVQDTLIWLLVSYVSDQLGRGLTVDGFLPALLGGLIVRAVTLGFIALTPERRPVDA